MNRLTHLHSRVRNAASIVSSASTAIALGAADVSSEFGDCFPSEPSETMLRWMHSNTVYEIEEGLSNDRVGDRDLVRSGAPDDPSRSDGDLEVLGHSDIHQPCESGIDMQKLRFC